MRQAHGDYDIDDDPARIDLDRVHRWLASSYWSPGVSLDTVRRAFAGSSLVIGAYLGNEQAGVVRVISDRATFAWICDVFVDESHRKRGLAKAMLNFALRHPQHQNLRRWVLATKDAHDVYAAVGFKPLPEPQRWMILKPGAFAAGAWLRP